MKSIAGKKKLLETKAPTNAENHHPHTHTKIDNCVLHTKKAHSMPEQHQTGEYTLQ